MVWTQESQQQYWGLLLTLPPASDKAAFSRKQTLLDWTSLNEPEGEEAGILFWALLRSGQKTKWWECWIWQSRVGTASEFQFPILPLGVALNITHWTFLSLPCTRLSELQVGVRIKPLLSISLEVTSVGSPGGGESTPPLRKEKKDKGPTLFSF